MSIEFEIENTPDYVHVICTGTYTLAGAYAVYEAAIEAARPSEVTAVVIDGREVGGPEPTTLERYEHGRFWAERLPGAAARFAIVGREPVIEPGRFGELVALNRGAPARVFTDFDEAVAWLRGTPPDPDGARTEPDLQ